MLVTFIIRVYAPMWFAIKVQSSCKDGARHVHQMLVKSRCLGPKHKKIVDPVIQRNAYFAHPENELLAMMTDHRPHTWELGLQRVKARAANCSGQIGKFKVSEKLNFDALQYFDMISWAVWAISEPPITRVMTDAELRELISKCQFPEIPLLHTGCGEMREAGDWSVQNCLWTEIARWLYPCMHASRQLMPTFKSKHDFSHFTL